MHDSVSTQPLPPVSCEQVRAHLNTALALLPVTAEETTELRPEPRTGRGRPLHLQQGSLAGAAVGRVGEGAGL